MKTCTTGHLQASYDTFGSTAAERARAQAAAAAASRPSAIPGAVPLEFFAPVSSSIGVQLLQKMGWRQGRGIGGPAAAAAAAANEASGSGSSSSKWGTIAGVSIENTPMYVLDPKQDLHGLGFDPFEGAEEFRTRKRQKLEAGRVQAQADISSGLGFGGQQRQQQQQQQRQREVAFGTGALEETDTMGYMEDYVDHSADVMARKGQRQEIFAYEEASESGERSFKVLFINKKF
jgi:G patch domain-containing protein 1